MFNPPIRSQPSSLSRNASYSGPVLRQISSNRVWPRKLAPAQDSEHWRQWLATAPQVPQLVTQRTLGSLNPPKRLPTINHNAFAGATEDPEPAFAPRSHAAGLTSVGLNGRATVPTTSGLFDMNRYEIGHTPYRGGFPGSPISHWQQERLFTLPRSMSVERPLMREYENTSLPIG